MINKQESDNVLGKNDISFEPLSPASENDSRKSASNPKTAPLVLSPTRVPDSDRQAAAPASNHTKSGWFVNLISFKQHSEAVRQASEFIRKGIRSEIIEVEVNHATWYRLRVGGFISKEQAAAYAEKIKKPLQLTSVWIASG